MDAMLHRTERIEEMDSDDRFLFPRMCPGRRCWITFGFGTTKLAFVGSQASSRTTNALGNTVDRRVRDYR